MILMKYRALCSILLGALTLTGCGAPSPEPGKISVTAGLYPYAWLAQEIGGAHVEVANLTPPGAEPHDLELTAKQVASVQISDLTIYEAGLQPNVDSAVAQTKPAHSLDVTTVVPLEIHDTDTDRNLDPHIWLDPMRMVAVAQAVTGQLIEIDQANEQAYTDNLASLISLLTSIDADYSSGLVTCDRTHFLTTHAAFGYMAERYGLTQISISGLSPDAEPSPDRIVEIHRIAQEQGLTTVFFETLTSPELAQSIAEDLHLRTDVLDPIEGITGQSRGTDYPQIMSSNLTALKQANGCR